MATTTRRMERLAASEVSSEVQTWGRFGVLCVFLVGLWVCLLLFFGGGGKGERGALRMVV